MRRQKKILIPEAWEDESLNILLSARTGISEITISRYLRDYYLLFEKNNDGEIIISPRNAGILLSLKNLLSQGLKRDEIICSFQGKKYEKHLPGLAEIYKKAEQKVFNQKYLNPQLPLLLPPPAKAPLILLPAPQAVQAVEVQKSETLEAVSQPSPSAPAEPVDVHVQRLEKKRVPAAALLIPLFLMAAVLIWNLGLKDLQTNTLQKGIVPEHTAGSNSWEGGIYTGDRDNGIPHGHGTIIWPDGTIYAGEWQGGKMEGEGEIKWPSGARYEGQWQKGMMHGEGIMFLPGGEVLHGTWEYGRHN